MMSVLEASTKDDRNYIREKRELRRKLRSSE